jgi:hypothetical protein
MSGRQCPKRLWNEVNAPLGEGLPDSVAFVFGRTFDQVVQTMEPGVVISREDGLPAAIQSTIERLLEPSTAVLFQPAFRHGELAVIADILRRQGKNRYDLVEVKASTKVKEEHLPDVAFQTMVLRGAEIGVKRAFIGHVNNEFVLKRVGDYRGLLVEQDVTRDVDDLQEGVEETAEDLQGVMRRRTAPSVEMGGQCHSPYECPFIPRCAREHRPEIKYPIDLLPRGGKVVEELAADGYEDLRKVPAGRLTSPMHRRVHAATVSGRPFFDASAALELRKFKGPKAYLDFETIQFSVPEIVGTRPYEQLPFQWSLHVEDARGELVHAEHLAIETFGDFDVLASELLAAVPAKGPVFAYNAGFEKRVLTGLATWLPRRAPLLRSLAERLVDLLPVTQQAYYHRDMLGSWSIKNVLPTIAQELDYAMLGDVQGGEAAQMAFLELRGPDVSDARRRKLRQELLDYCRRDTFGLIVLRRFLCEEPLGI